MTKYLFGFGVLFLISALPAHASAAIAIDASISASISSGASQTLPYTVTGTDPFLLVGVLIQADQTCSGVTYNGVAMTQVGAVKYYANASENEYTFYLLNPATGTHDIVTSYSGTGTNGIVAASYSGVGSVDTSQISSDVASTTITNTMTTAAPNEWLVGYGRTAITMTAGSGTTIRQSGSNENIVDSNGALTQGSHSLTISQASTTDFIYIGAVAISPTVTPPSSITGSGTTNRIAKFTGSTSIGDSLFSDNGLNVTLTAGNLLFSASTSLDTATTGVFGIGVTNATSINIGRPAGTISLLAPATFKNFSALSATTTSISSGMADFTSLSISGASALHGFTFTTAIGTSATTTNFAATNLYANTFSATTSTIGTITAGSVRTTSNCSSSATPAVCGSAPAGSVAMATGVSTLVVNTTAVTANSQILIIEDSSLGARLGITCNINTGRVYSINVRTAGTSFTIKSSANPQAPNKACLSYLIVN